MCVCRGRFELVRVVCSQVYLSLSSRQSQCEVRLRDECRTIIGGELSLCCVIDVVSFEIGAKTTVSFPPAVVIHRNI